jgi:hypothetical protein
MKRSKTTTSLIGRLHLGDDILRMADLKQPAHLLAPWLRRGSIALLHAKPGTKKTYLALSIALAVSRGEELLGWKPGFPGKPRKVVYLDAELPFWLMRKRLQQLEAGKGASIMVLSREDLPAPATPTHPKGRSAHVGVTRLGVRSFPTQPAHGLNS